MVEGMAQAQFNPEPGPGTPHSAPPLTVAPARADGSDEGLSLRTLMIAAAASAVAAVVTSAFWKGGTVISATITPVIVAIVKEIVERPKDVVRRASAFTSTTTPGTKGRGRGDRPGAPVAPIRTYGRPARRRIHLKLAIVTGLIAFVLAAAVLTVPELLFGGSVASKSGTTIFGGKDSSSPKPSAESKGQSKPQSGQPPAQTPPSGTDGTQQPDAQAQPAPGSSAAQPPAQQPPAPGPSDPVPSTPAPTP